MPKKKQTVDQSESLVTWPKKFSKAKKPVLLLVLLLLLSLVALTVVECIKHKSLTGSIDKLALQLSDVGVGSIGKSDTCSQLKLGLEEVCTVSLVSKKESTDLGELEHFFYQTIQVMDNQEQLPLPGALSEKIVTPKNYALSTSTLSYDNPSIYCEAFVDLYPSDKVDTFVLKSDFTCVYNFWWKKLRPL